MTGTERTNPYGNPKPGDRVRGKSGRIRECTRRDGGNVYYIAVGQGNAREKCCWISTWSGWAREIVI